MRIFYASDVHASNRCFKKFLNAGKFYNCDALVLGGDITGKAIVPFVEEAPGEVHVTFLGRRQVLRTEEEIRAVEQRVGDTGYYPHRCDRGRGGRARPRTARGCTRCSCARSSSGWRSGWRWRTSAWAATAACPASSTPATTTRPRSTR